MIRIPALTGAAKSAVTRLSFVVDGNDFVDAYDFIRDGSINNDSCDYDFDRGSVEMSTFFNGTGDGLSQGPHPAVEVAICVTFLKIGEIDTLKEQYQADVMIKSTWRDPAFDNMNVKSIRKIDWHKSWNPQIIIENTNGELRENAFQTVTFNQAQEAYVVEKRRIKGMFLETLELRDFPFDIQDLTVTVTSERPASEVQLTENENELHSVSRRSFIDEQEWYLYKFIYTEKKELVNEYSDPLIRRTALCVKCQAARRPAYFFWNIFLITFLICSLSFATFAVHRSLPQNRLQLSFTLVLTSVAFKFVVNQSLPKISYLTYLDKYVLATLIILVFVCAWHGFATKIPPGDFGDIIDNCVFFGFLSLYFFFNVIFIIRLSMKPGKKRRVMRKKEKRYMETVKEHIRQVSIAKQRRDVSVDNVSVTAV